MSRFIARFAALSALLFLVPVTLQAQGQDRQGGMMGGQGGQGGAQMLQMLLISPAGFALENRADLELTEEQAPRLQALHDAYEEKNEAHLEILRARAEAMGAMQGQGQRQGGQGMQGQGQRQGGQGMQGQRQRQGGQGMQGQRGQGGGAMGGDMAEMQGAMQAVREARQAQMEALGDMLSANQLRQLREMMMPRNPGGPGGSTTR